MTLCCSHVQHSYARHIIAQKLQAGGSSVTYACFFSGIKRIIDMDDQMQWVPKSRGTRPAPGRAQIGSGDCSLHSITESFLRLRSTNGQNYLNARCITAVPLIWGVFKQFCQLIKSDCKKVIPGPDQVPLSDIGTGMCLGPEFRPIAM